MTGALGIRSKLTREDRVKEREKLKEAKSKIMSQSSTCLVTGYFNLVFRLGFPSSDFDIIGLPRMCVNEQDRYFRVTRQKNSI